MKPARSPPLPVVLFLLPLSSPVAAAGAPVTGMPAPDAVAWPALVVLGVIGIVVTVGILICLIRLIVAFHGYSAALAGSLRALAPEPSVTFPEYIAEGTSGWIEMTIASSAAVPFSQVTALLTPSSDLSLEGDPVVIPGLDPKELRVFRLNHGPVKRGKYPVGVTILYRIGDEDRIVELTRVVRAGTPGGPDRMTDE